MKKIIKIILVFVMMLVTLPVNAKGFGVGKNAKGIRPNVNDPIITNNNGYAIGPDDNRVYLTFDCGYENGYTAKILDTLKVKELKEIAKKYNIDSIGLFGSRARGDFNEQSDYDIFIIGNIDLNTELRLEYDLEKKLDSEVDVIKINNETDKMFLKNILNEAIVFLDDKGKFNSTYREIEKFFIENSDFIELRERDLSGES